MNGEVDLVAEMLSAYLDGELSDAEGAAVESQLAASAAWRAELHEVRAARLVLRQLPVRRAPEGFWDAVAAQVAGVDVTHEDVTHEQDERAAPVVPITATRSRRRWAWVAASAAAVAAVVAVIVVPHHREVSPDVATVVVQHGAQGSEANDPVSMLAPVGPLAGFRR